MKAQAVLFLSMAVRDKQNKTGLGIRERTTHKYFCEGGRENNTRGDLDMTMQRLPGQRTVLGPFLRHYDN